MTRINQLMEWASLRGDIYTHYSYQGLDRWYFAAKINGKNVDFNYVKHGNHIILNGTANVGGRQYGTIAEMEKALE